MHDKILTSCLLTTRDFQTQNEYFHPAYPLRTAVCLSVLSMVFLFVFSFLRLSTMLFKHGCNRQEFSWQAYHPLMNEPRNHIQSV